MRGDYIHKFIVKTGAIRDASLQSAELAKCVVELAIVMRRDLGLSLEAMGQYDAVFQDHVLYVVPKRTKERFGDFPTRIEHSLKVLHLDKVPEPVIYAHQP